MKTLIKQMTLLFTTVLLSGNALAGFNPLGPLPYAIDTVSPQQLLRDCGSVKKVGYSSIFGSPSSYREHYPNMGKLSAELESIRRISGSIKSFARETFTDAKVKKENVLKSNQKSNQFMEKNAKYISASENLKADTMAKYNQNLDILQDTSDYITTKTLKDIKSKLKSKKLDKRQYLGDNYDVLSTCRKFWRIEGAGRSFYSAQVKMHRTVAEKHRDVNEDVLEKNYELNKYAIKKNHDINRSAAEGNHAINKYALEKNHDANRFSAENHRKINQTEQSNRQWWNKEGSVISKPGIGKSGNEHVLPVNPEPTKWWNKK